MAASTRRSREPVLRSLSPAGRFYSSHSTPSASSSAFASSSSSFSSRSSTFFHRSASPTRVNMYGSAPSASSVRFSLDRPISPSRSISASPRNQVVKKPSNNPLSSPARTQKRTCMCSPTTHPESFGGFDSTVVSPATETCCVSAEAESAFNHVKSGGFVMKSGYLCRISNSVCTCLRFGIPYTYFPPQNWMPKKYSNLTLENTKRWTTPDRNN
ncbi:hypothetical protein F0562_030241 [Nyssa sinensis]|uniref:Uncharacterized protein n=1 Tax=Nyssa sinensis TaxID=561372 RepID=A0A5J5AYD9_9ASTE|nr:hypothetical protein F0562_030241 [Nyssa sinensis]